MATRGTKHYHGHTGMPGYLSNTSVTVGTKADLETWAKEEKRQWLDSFLDTDEQVEQYRLLGNVRTGYWWWDRINDREPTEFPDQISPNYTACRCHDVWLCDEGTWCDEYRCWCCGEKAPVTN